MAAYFSEGPTILCRACRLEEKTGSNNNPLEQQSV